MLDATRDDIAFAQGRSRADLDSDRQLAFALVRCMEIIGEAANGVSRDTQSRFPSIPWIDMIGMRHRLIHAYFDVDLDLVWDTVQDDLPPLVGLIEEVLHSIIQEQRRG